MAAAELPALDRFLSYRLHQVGKLTDRVSSDAYAAEFGLPVGEARCLAAIGNFAPLSVNQLAYKVTSERSILVFPDNPQKHAQYDDQVLQTFYVSHADVSELTQLLTQLIRLPAMAVQPAITFNKTSNTITVRATAPVVQIIERIITANDKPRAEVMVDVQILEVSRERAKQYGLDPGK